MSGNRQPWERWRWALLDFTYWNIGFDLKQLIKVLHCDLQVEIHEGLVEAQDDILEAIANFANNFHITVTTLSAPGMHALLDHMHARHAGSHSFLAAVRHSTTLTRMESFLGNGPTKLLQSFFNWLPDHQIDIERGSTHPTELEMEVSHFSKGLKTCKPDSHAWIQLWNLRHPNYQPYKRQSWGALPTTKGQHCWWPLGWHWDAHNSTWFFELPPNCSWWVIPECSSFPHRLWCSSRHIICFHPGDYSYNFVSHRQAAFLPSDHL